MIVHVLVYHASIYQILIRKTKEIDVQMMTIGMIEPASEPLKRFNPLPVLPYPT